MQGAGANALISSPPTVNDWSVYECSLGPAGMTSPAPQFPQLLHLRIIVIHNNHLGDDVIIALYSAISSSSSSFSFIHQLDFRQVQMTHVGLRSFMSCIAHFPLVTALYLSNNPNIGNFGIFFLSRVFGISVSLIPAFPLLTLIFHQLACLLYVASFRSCHLCLYLTCRTIW